MDVIISAPQGGGKTRAAMVLATGYLNAPSWNHIATSVLTIDSPDKLGDSPGTLADLIEASKAEVVIFDGSITSPKNLQHAVRAVQRYRNRCIHPDALLAIYIEQHGARAVSLQFL